MTGETAIENMFSIAPFKSRVWYYFRQIEKTGAKLVIRGEKSGGHLDDIK
jgi:hypothetical protein